MERDLIGGAGVESANARPLGGLATEGRTLNLAMAKFGGQGGTVPGAHPRGRVCAAGAVSRENKGASNGFDSGPAGLGAEEAAAPTLSPFSRVILLIALAVVCVARGQPSRPLGPPWGLPRSVRGGDWPWLPPVAVLQPVASDISPLALTNRASFAPRGICRTSFPQHGGPGTHRRQQLCRRQARQRR